MRTTLTLDDDVFSKLKAEARKSGRPFKELVNELLRAGMSLRKSYKGVGPFVVKARPLGSKPGLNYDNIGELLDQLEGPLHR